MMSDLTRNAMWNCPPEQLQHVVTPHNACKEVTGGMQLFGTQMQPKRRAEHDFVIHE